MALVITSVNGEHVASVPLVGGVAPLLAVPRTILTIGGSGFEAGATVRAIGVKVGGVSDGPLRAVPASSSTTEIRVRVPSLDELQTTNAAVPIGPTSFRYKYERNAVLMPLAIKIENPSGAFSAPILLGVVLPSPSVGAARTTGRQIRIGNVAGVSRPPRGRPLRDQPVGTGHLGAPVAGGTGSDRIGGEIRWYDPSTGTEQFAFDVTTLLPAPADFANYLVSSLSNPTKTAPATLQGLRRDGRRLSPISWQDDGVSFEIPSDATLGGVGLAVIWRDDLPATPLLIDITPKITHVNDQRVDSVPLVGGVAPLLVTPRSKLTIQGSGFEAGATVRAIGVEVGGVPDGPLRPDTASSSTTEIRVRVPSLDELQTTHGTVNVPVLQNLSYKYQRNAVWLPLAIKVENPTGTLSTPIMLGVTLPPPSLGDPHVSGGTVTMGCFADDPAGTENLGLAVPTENDQPIPNSIGCQIRWYDSSLMKSLPLVTFDHFPPDPGELAVPLVGSDHCLPDPGEFTVPDLRSVLTRAAEDPSDLLKGFWDTLASIRDKGQFIEPMQGCWQDDGLAFAIPPDAPFGMGLLVLWRDDLPSVPVPIWNLDFDCANATDVVTAIQSALDEVWSILPWAHNADGSPFAVGTPFAPGDWVPLVVERAAGGLNNVVAHLLATKDTGFKVQFWFDLKGQHGNGKPVAGHDTTWEPSVPTDSAGAVDNEGVLPFAVGPGSRTPLRMQVKPNFDPWDGESEITVQLKASVRIPGQPSTCSLPDFTIGGPIAIRQKPIDIPSLAVFFTGTQCGQQPLFVLPSGQSVPGLPQGESLPGLPSGAFWDLRGLFLPAGHQAKPEYETFSLARGHVLRALWLVTDVLDVLSLANEDWVISLKGALRRFEAAAEFVIDTTGEIADLGQRVYEPGGSFGKRIESVILVGTSKYEFHCYDVFAGQPNGSELTLSVPDGHYVAAFPDLRNLTTQLTLARPKGTPFKVPLPKVTLAGPLSRWGGCMARIKVVEA